MGKWENSAMISLCSAPGARLVAPDSLQHGMRIGIGEFLNEAAPSGAPNSLWEFGQWFLHPKAWDESSGFVTSQQFLLCLL